MRCYFRECSHRSELSQIYIMRIIAKPGSDGHATIVTLSERQRQDIYDWDAFM